MEDARNLSLQQRAIVHRKRNACLYKGNYRLARKNTHLLTSLHSDCLMQFNAFFTYRLLSLSNWYAKTLTSSCVPTILRFCDAVQRLFDTQVCHHLMESDGFLMHGHRQTFQQISCQCFGKTMATSHFHVIFGGWWLTAKAVTKSPSTRKGCALACTQTIQAST